MVSINLTYSQLQDLQKLIDASIEQMSPTGKDSFSEVLSAFDSPDVISETPKETGLVNGSGSVNLLLSELPSVQGAKPTVGEFMDMTGLSFIDATELLYGVVGANGDFRDWDAIMQSDDIVGAVRSATEQLYTSDKDYALAQITSPLDPDYEELIQAYSANPSSAANINEMYTLSGENDKAPDVLVSSTNLQIRALHSNESVRAKTLWYFNQDLL